MEMIKPKITYEENTEKGNYAKFVIEPLERGYGTTLGNSLRRFLLSALPGAAPVGIQIAGVDHEFSTIKGVREDVTEIILNRFQRQNRPQRTYSLQKHRRSCSCK
mgnify:CR=1 FL=1